MVREKELGLDFLESGLDPVGVLKNCILENLGISDKEIVGSLIFST